MDREGEGARRAGKDVDMFESLEKILEVLGL